MARFAQKPNFVAPKVPRSNYNLNRKRYAGYEIGKLYPVSVIEAAPRSSYRITPDIALRLAPLAVQLQSDIRVDIDYFKVRTRNLWRRDGDNAGFDEFIHGTDDGTAVMPWIKRTKEADFFGLGGLSDHLGVPVTRPAVSAGMQLYPQRFPDTPFGVSSINDMTSITKVYQTAFASPVSLDNRNTHTLGSSNPTYGSSIIIGQSTVSNSWFMQLFTTMTTKTRWSTVASSIVIDFPLTGNVSISSPVAANFALQVFSFNANALWYHGSISPTSVSYSGSALRFSFPRANIEFLNTLRDNIEGKYGAFLFGLAFKNDGSSIKITGRIENVFQGFSVATTEINPYALKDSQLPYYGAMPDTKLNALYYRCYEYIFNGWYRNTLLDPLIINGHPRYNDFLSSYAGGEDTYDYSLHQRPYRNDFWNSAQKTPQFGDAAMVGVRVKDGSTMALQFEENGNTHNVEVKVDSHANVVAISNYDQNLPANILDNLRDAAVSGVSIPDLRAASAFQRWKERNQLRGKRYRDQMLAHWGVAPSSSTLDYPEYIGGTSQHFSYTEISQTTENDFKSLGESVKKGSAVKSGRPISCYCDEHSIIMGILSINVEPANFNAIPKAFLKHGKFDFLHPELVNVGLVPIENEEVAPVLCDSNNRHKTFGYVPYGYDYCNTFDSIHGDYRTTLRNCVISREFSEVPQLSASLVNQDEKHLQNPFATSGVPHIYGIINESIKAKLPIPKGFNPSI